MILDNYARLDAARGASALVVLLAHANQILFVRLPSTSTVQTAIAGMLARHALLIFFLLSGYLITKSICANIERHSGRFNVLDYVASRVARIYPPLIGSIIIALLIAAIIHLANLPGGTIAYGLPGDVYRPRSEFTISLSEILSALTMRDGLNSANAPLWSLYMEFQIYFVAMAVVVWWRFTGFLVVPLILLAAIIVITCLAPPGYPLFACVWLVGCALALWQVPKYVGYTIGIGGVACIFVLALDRPDLLAGESMDTTGGIIIQFMFSLTYAALLFVVPLRMSYPKALARSGGFSYTLYVIHWPLLMLALSLGQNWIQHSVIKTWFVAIVALAVIIPIAILCSKIFENKKIYKAHLLLWWSIILSLPDRLVQRFLPYAGRGEEQEFSFGWLESEHLWTEPEAPSQSARFTPEP